MSSSTICSIVGVGLAGQAREHLDEHGDHDLGPPLPDQRERAVEVEEHVADLGAGLERGGELDARPPPGAGTIREGAHDPPPAASAASMKA